MQEEGELKLLEGLTFRPTINKRIAMKNMAKLSFASTINVCNSQGNIVNFENTRIQ